jgi:hypothetical protein
MQETLPMSLQQLSHLDVLRQAERRNFTRIQVAELLGVNEKTIRRQLIRLNNECPSFLQYGLKGRNLEQSYFYEGRKRN